MMAWIQRRECIIPVELFAQYATCGPIEDAAYLGLHGGW
jgi:hypothetical protein